MTKMLEAFKHQEDKYLRLRPTYPPKLFNWLAALAPGHNLAWDCGTGSGQAAIGLADHFNSVIATDGNYTQLKHAMIHPRILYAATLAEHSVIPSKSVDLITAACAVHWFNQDKFYKEAARVLQPNGVIAVWTYSWPYFGVDEIDNILTHYKDDILEPFWSEVSQIYFDRYETINFPFEETKVPDFSLTCNWDAETLLEFFSTWSAPQLYFRKTGKDSIEQIRDEFLNAWARHNIGCMKTLPLYFRVGRPKF